MNFKLLTSLLLLTACQPLLAQQSASNAELRLLAFNPEMQQEGVFIQDPASAPDAPSAKSDIKTYLNHEFAAVPLKGRKLVITTKSDRASLTREGELLGEVTLPEGGNSSILLFLPGKPGSKAKYQIMPIPDSKKAFPAGSFHITNLSPLPLRLLLEKKLFEFKPGQTSLVENPPVRSSGQVGMRASAFKNNEWAEISTGLWPHPGEARVLMIMFQDPTSGNVKLKGFDDISPRVPKEPVAAP